MNMIFIAIFLQISFSQCPYNQGFDQAQLDFYAQWGLIGQVVHDNLPCADWMSTNPTPASGDEQTNWHNPAEEDWSTYFDTSGWKTLQSQRLMTGWVRGGHASNGDHGINFIEGITTAEPGVGFQESDCEDEDWVNDLDMMNFWAVCGENKALHGLRRTAGQNTYNIEEGRCCTGVTNNCYTEDSVSQTLDFEGVSKCAPGHAMAGFYRGTCDDLHCIEKFKCCRLVNYDPNYVHVIGYWTKESFQRQAWDVEKTVTKTMVVGQSDEVTNSEQSEWQTEVQQTNSVTVAVEASAEYGAASASLSAEYGYENTQSHGSSFGTSLHTTATNTFEQAIEVTEQFTIPAVAEGEPIYANIWYFHTKAIKPNAAGGFVASSHSQLNNGLTKTGCGYDIAPNCLPGHCKHDDPQCFECESTQWKIDPDFQNPCDLTCCDAIQISGFPTGVQTTRDGLFVKVEGVTQNYLPVYQNTDGQYLYYWDQSDDWSIGSDYTSDSVGVVSLDNKRDCPQTFSAWKVYNGNGVWTDITSSVSVTCTSAPTDKLLVSIAADGESNLGLCEGDCDSNDDCAAGLSCFQRNGLTPVPGCSGAGNTNWDYCYDPSEAAVGSSPVDIANSASLEGAKLAMDNAFGIEDFSEILTKILAFFGVGAVIYGIARRVIRKTEYKTIDEPDMQTKQAILCIK